MAEFKTLKDSGKREDMETGSRRDTQDGKPRPDLMNPLVLRRLSMHFANGCEKYGEKNFELGQKTSRYRASLGRHLLDYDEGKKDEDHLSAIIWNAMGIMMNQEFIERGIYDPALDDFSDYRDYDGFYSTVGHRAMKFNDELRKAEEMNSGADVPILIDHQPTFCGDTKQTGKCLNCTPECDYNIFEESENDKDHRLINCETVNCRNCEDQCTCDAVDPITHTIDQCQDEQCDGTCAGLGVPILETPEEPTYCGQEEQNSRCIECTPRCKFNIKEGDLLPEHMRPPIPETPVSYYGQSILTLPMVSESQTEFNKVLSNMIDSCHRRIEMVTVEALGHTGFCMDDFRANTCGDCPTLDKCMKMCSDEADELLEDLIDVPELPVCFGDCQGGNNKVVCNSCPDDAECDTLFCNLCDFHVECSEANDRLATKDTPPVFSNTGCNGCVSRLKAYTAVPCCSCTRNANGSDSIHDYHMSQAEFDRATRP